MHRFHDACILRLACAGQDMREYFFFDEFIFFGWEIKFLFDDF